MAATINEVSSTKSLPTNDGGGGGGIIYHRYQQQCYVIKVIYCNKELQLSLRRRRWYIW